MNEIVLLDGGMGQELIARSSQPASPLWSAKVLVDEPQLVAAVHRDYIDAGATVLTLNTYAVTPQRLAAQGSEELFETLQAQACDSVTLRSGETLAEGVAALRELGVDARLLNCSRPEAISAAWGVFAAGDGVTGAYANGFTSIDGLKPGGTVDALEARRDLSPDAYADFAMSWVERGASIVGGCCEVGPAHIRRLREGLEAADHTVARPSSR
jgi:S-methylmethionine-dependent homocysteine/selenocysteine methylase